MGKFVSYHPFELVVVKRVDNTTCEGDGKGFLVDTGSKSIERIALYNIELGHRHSDAHTKVLGEVIHPHILTAF